MGPVEKSMRAKLEKAFKVVVLEITNDSGRHKGHAGNPGGGESHFRVKIVSDDFDGLSRMDRHRWVFEVLRDEMDQEIHALSLSLKTSLEAKK